MRTYFPRPSLKLRQAYTDHLKKVIKPNVCATITLVQSRSYEDARGREFVWYRPDDIGFEGIYKGLVNRLSHAVLGNAYRRYGKRLLASGALEGDGEEQLFHFHAHIRRPDGYDPEKFASQITSVWLKSPWVKQDLHIEEIHRNWVWYTTKRGPEALLFP